MDYYKFNGQEVITFTERKEIVQIMARNFKMCMILQNEIYGLFDGYKYHGIEQRIHDDKNIALADKIELKKICDKISWNAFVNK